MKFRSTGDNDNDDDLAVSDDNERDKDNLPRIDSEESNATIFDTPSTFYLVYSLICNVHVTLHLFFHRPPVSLEYISKGQEFNLKSSFSGSTQAL